MRKARYEVGKRSELAPDIGQTVKLGEGECTLFLHEGKCHATGSVCPHQNAPLNNAPVEKGKVICRRHCYRFDLKTGDCATIGGYGIPIFTVIEEGDTIFVEVWEYED